MSQTRSEAEMGELAAAYWECRQRVATLVAALDGPTASTPVPACPGWSVRDVVAHLTGIVDDALAGRLEGAATDAWTARQVDSRRDLSVARMLSDWTAQAALFEPLLDLAGEGGRQAVADIACHEQDIRGALHRPGARDTSSMRIAVEWVAEQVVSSARSHGMALRVCSEDGFAVGPVDAATVVTASSWELLRALTGRRSEDQLLQMEWQGDARAVLPAFRWLTLRPATSSIEE